MRILLLLLLLSPTAGLTKEIARLNADLTGDGLIDRAVLSENTHNSTAGLKIWVRQADNSLKLHTNVPEISWVGSMAGQQPKLAVTPIGSLQIISMNISMGRHRWRETLTVAWRKAQFVLAGFTYSWHDTLDERNVGKCDVNLLNGKGEMVLGPRLEKTTFRNTSSGGPIADWDQVPPTECFKN